MTNIQIYTGAVSMQYRNTTTYISVYCPPLLTPYIIPILTSSHQPHTILTSYLVSILTPSHPPSPHPHPWLLCSSHWVFRGLLCLVDGLQCVQYLVQQEGSVVNQHVQVEVEGRVLSLNVLAIDSAAYIFTYSSAQDLFTIICC